ncbi:1,2-phenylacetyl-CoA epoxidase subunit PaaD [Streptomyces sp. YIM 98790]|uniref:1,2-phenylacetyl-CoA epoxidase subunit PaaD n=1 Tax=Streptomyces sp. YIM 98790 TaxID=2689077 RepID=UPI0037DCEBAD
MPDPELPVISLAELGVLRGLRLTDDGRTAEVELTPTYTGCPAVEAMAEDIRQALHRADPELTRVEVRTVLSPPWSTEDITEEGRRKLAEAGIAPPRHLGAPGSGGPVPVALAIRCPHCGSTDTELLSRFSSTACKALRRCRTCREPFDHVKEV